MDVQITIALITALTALVVSILNSRKSYTNQKLIEEHKTELQTKIQKNKIDHETQIIKEKKNDERVKEMFLEKSKSIRNCIKGMQDIKDSLTLVIRSYDKSLSYSEFIGNAKDTALALVQIYKQEMNNLDDEILKIVHASKGRAQDYNELISDITEQDYNKGISIQIKEKLISEKEYFSRKQDILREKLNTMRDEFYAT